MIDDIKGILENCHFRNAQTSKLKDKDSQMEIILSDMPSDRLIVRVPDKGRAHLGIVKDTNNYKKSCDYLIFIPCGKKMDIYFIEMKKTFHGDNKKSHQQIISTIPVFEYLKKMIEVHHSIPKIINIHFVIVYGKISGRLDKQGVKPRSSKVQRFRNKKFKIFYSENIPFKQLKCTTP